MPPPLGIIEVIHATLIRVSTSCQRGILSITPQQEPKVVNCPRKKLKSSREKIAFNDNDLERFLVKRVMIDKGSGRREYVPQSV